MKALLLLFCSALLIGCSSDDLPSIADPPQLVADCAALTADGTVLIPKDKWPKSIAKLSPVEVTKDLKGVHITTFEKTGVGSRGYLVADAKPADEHNLVYSATDYPSIFRFDFKP